MTAAPRRILGIDPGLRFTGWGVITSVGNHLQFIDCGIIPVAANLPIAERLCGIFSVLQNVIQTHQPTEAAIEEIFVNKNPSSTLKLGMARGAAMLAPGLLGIPCFEYATNQVKKSVVGTGHADKTQIAAMIGHLLPGAKAQKDAADALAVAICHAHQGELGKILAAQSA